MGTGARICESCTEFTSLLSSYDGKRTNLSTFSDIIISREEVETIFLFLQSWVQRQCSCCFRDQKNFERYNWALQTIILVVIEILKRLGVPKKEEKKKKAEFIIADLEEPAEIEDDGRRAVWDIEDKDKLLHFVARIFLNNFPTYVAYKQHMQMKNEEVTPAEIQSLSIYCEINEPEMSPYLFRNVALFCKERGMEEITDCLKRNGPESLLLHQVNILVNLATNVKVWINFVSLVKFYVPLRREALGYMCKLVDQQQELKTGSARNMAEYIWSSIKDPVDAHLSFDRDGLDLAFKYFLCPTLTMRLAGVNQINNYINLFNELLNSEHIRDPDNLYNHLCRWLLDNQIVEHIFGPNLHVEVIKQSHTILSFLAMENHFTNEHVEIIWQAAQLKHCSKQVFDILSSLICHMEPGPVLHLHHLLKKLEAKDHSEQSLYLASALIKFIWTNAASALAEEQQLLQMHSPMGGGFISGNMGMPSLSPMAASTPAHGIRKHRRHNIHVHRTSRRRLRKSRAVGGGYISSSESNSPSPSQSEEEEDEDEDIENIGPQLNNSRPRGLRLLDQMKPKKVLGSSDGSGGLRPPQISPYYSHGHHHQLILTESSSEESLSDDVSASPSGGTGETGSAESGRSVDADVDVDCIEDGENTPLSSGYVLTHSDSDADEERSGNENEGAPTIGLQKAKTTKKYKIVRKKKVAVKGPLAAVKSKTTTGGLSVKGRRIQITNGKQVEIQDASSSQNNSPGTSKQSRDDLSGVSVVPVLKEQQTAVDPVDLDSSTVISQLGSLVQMQGTELPPVLQEFSATDLLDDASEGDGSYSSRMSTKSEKNMADFDGEDSNVDEENEELMQTLNQTQLVELATRNQLRKRCGSGTTGTLLLPPRAMRMLFRRKRFQSPTAFNFQIDTICQPGQTLLWDLIQDDKIVQLSEGLAIEAQKALTNLLCFGADKLIRLKFIEGCINNIVENQAVVVSLRLLQKLFTSFSHNHLRLPGDIHHVTMWSEKEHHMLEKFFNNLQQFSKDVSLLEASPFPYHVHVQARLEFLSVIFSTLASPEDFQLSVEQVNQLWESLATDPKCSDDLFVWLASQVRARDQHALSYNTFGHILIHKLPSLPPETITMHSLTLFNQLCNMQRLTMLQELDAGQLASMSMDYLWKIALYANSTDVSMTAIQYLNNYYIGKQLEKEEEFVQRCMGHLAKATEELSCLTDESPLLRIQRALLLLKSHLELFRRRYAYHLRKWALDGEGVGSHAQLVGDKGAATIRIVLQPAGNHEKATLELLTTDYVADLRAEVAKWWETIQGNVAIEKSSSNNTTPVLGSLLSEGPIRMITQGIELSGEYDEKILSDVPIKDLQLVYVSVGVTRSQKKKDIAEYSSLLSPPSRNKLPVTLLLQPLYFEQLFSLMKTLSELKSFGISGNAPHMKAQMYSRRVWDILMLLPTNPEIYKGFKSPDTSTFRALLDPSSPQKLMYSLYIVESLVKLNNYNLQNSSSIRSGDAPLLSESLDNWKHEFVEKGGLAHLFEIFSSGVLEAKDNKEWSEWKQDCLASLLKFLCYLGVKEDETEYLNELLYDVNEAPKKRVKRRKGSQEKTPIPRLNETMLSIMEIQLVMTRLTNILQACAHPRDPNHYKTGFWGRAQVVHYAMALLVCWSFSSEPVRSTLYSQPEFSVWLRKLVLEDPEPAVRREVCMGLYRLCLGISTDGGDGVSCAPALISHLLKSLNVSLSIQWNQYLYLRQDFTPNSIPSLLSSFEEGKEPYGPACRDYFWLLGRLLDSLDEKYVRQSFENPSEYGPDLDRLSEDLRHAINSREYFETRHNTICDDGLVGLLNVMVVVMKHNPPFKTSPTGQRFLKEVFDCIFALPSPSQRFLPKCKSQPSRSAAYDLLAEMARCAPDNFFVLQSLLIEQHQPPAHNPYVWDYWPHEDGRAPCGYVGLTNLGATCYMASCMQHLYMMPQARAAILKAKLGLSSNRHEETLRELQKMFAYLMESERKAYNPRGFCKVYQMDHKPLNTGEQKDMAEYFIDLVSKLEEMTPELRKLVKTLFCGVTSNNVVSLDCPHVSRTLEEFYTVRCQVADMRSLYESLDEVTVKDTLEGDNMYTCSTCTKKVRAEKRACFKKLPHLLCFNTMRYTFNMITMMKEKVNTHFSFPIQLDMSGYVEKTLMPQQYQEEKAKQSKDTQSYIGAGGEDGQQQQEDEEECYLYDLIGVTVHTGTADGGHYYSFIRDRLPPNKDKWYLFNDAEVKQFDPNQLPNECFGGEMNTKTYDSVTDKFMDFSFEKTNSAYMLFYERSTPNATFHTSLNGNELQFSLPGGSSSLPPPSSTAGLGQVSVGQCPVGVGEVTLPNNSNNEITFELSKELEDWIWMDNTQFLKDKNIFEHTYFNFMSQVCCQIPVTLFVNDDIMILAAKLSTTFFLETFIHAKEKPTMMQWMEFLTKQLMMCSAAASWFLEYMAEPENTWLLQILIKCPNQMVRQMFQRLCFHVIQHIRPTQVQLYMKMPEGEDFDHPDDVNMVEFGSYSSVSKFIKRYLQLLDQNAKAHLKHLAEYFTFLLDFTKLGDEECLLLLNIQAITTMINFYMGNKKDEALERGNEEEGGEEEEEEVLSIPTEKSKVASLERMIALVASLVEKSRDETNALKLSTVDRESLLSARKGSHFYNFPFILQQIRDGINYTSSRNLIFALGRWNDGLAEEIIIAIFQAIQKHPDMCHPYFKVLNLLAELMAGPVGMPKFTELILSRILDVSEICPYPTLEWLGAQVPRNKGVHNWCLQSMGNWVEHFLITNNNQRVRNAAASLLVSLVPSQQFRQGYRTTKLYGAHQGNRELLAVTGEALGILHEIYSRLLQLLKPARHYTDVNSHGTSKLVTYFGVMTYFANGKAEKLMFSQYFHDLWNLFHPRLSEPSVPCHHNKAAVLTFWHHVSTDCPENLQKITQNPTIVKQIGFNYILADHEDQEVVMFNRSMLPCYYAILRMCCQQSRNFCLSLARHQNITWAFKNISPFQTQYPAAVEELFKLMQIIVEREPGASEQEILEINNFKRSTLQLYMQVLDGRSSWGTLISAFRILVENIEDRIFVVMNSGLNLLFDAISMLHTMHHEATACHVTGEIVELLSLLTEILRSFRPKEFAHGMQSVAGGDISIHRFITGSKDWPDVLRKLVTFLNTYNCADLRNSATEALVEFLYLLPMDTLRTLVPLMVHCHTACQDAQTSGMGPTLGPYFPKRSSHGNTVTLKPTLRPPRPMLQMAFPHLGQETAKGLDEEYDRQLQEFYGQYHYFVDLMCRVAFMKDFVNQELITLSAMLGYEAAPLHFIHFPKLWLEVYNTPSIDRKHIMMLVNTNYFTDFVELVFLEERTCLTNIMIYNFFATYLPKVFDQLLKTDQICKVLLSIKQDMVNLVNKKITDIEPYAATILGDLKAISLFYLPSVNGKGESKQPLPHPAPTIPQLLAALKQLNRYLKTLLKNVNTHYGSGTPSSESGSPVGARSPSGEVPATKKRKMESLLESDPQQGPSSSSSTSLEFFSPATSPLDNSNCYYLSEEATVQKRTMMRDFILLLLGTIDNFVNGIDPSAGQEEEEEDEGEPPEQEGDKTQEISFSEGNANSAEQKADSKGEEKNNA